MSSLDEESIGSVTPSDATISSQITASLASTNTPSSMSSIDLENPKNRVPFKERISERNILINEETNVNYDSDCL